MFNTLPKTLTTSVSSVSAITTISTVLIITSPATVSIVTSIAAVSTTISSIISVAVAVSAITTTAISTVVVIPSSISTPACPSQATVTMAAPAAVENFVNSIRTLAHTKRIRVTLFFQDFDKLRSGFVTVPQFSRCLWQTLGIQLTPEQEELVKRHYDIKGDGQFINYKLLGTVRSVRPLTPGSERRLVQLLRRIDQFYRPPDVNEADMNLLVQKYRDPDRPGLLNYLNLHHDIVAIGGQVAKEKELIEAPNTQVDETRVMLTPDPDLNTIFDKIRVAVFKNGIRTTEFFKDHDKLRSGIITENQFVCGLALAVGKEAQLSRAEIQKVVEYYRQPDGRVKYKEFCDIMENAFTIPDLEKKPLQSGLTPLTDQEEGRVMEILRTISDNVRRRRLMMYPYFKDYDRFGRILHFLSLNVAPEDLKLLLRKFEDPATGDVNYPAFVQAVDQEFVGHTMDDADLSQAGRTNTPMKEREATSSDSNVSYDDLMSRIRSIVLTNRLRPNLEKVPDLQVPPQEIFRVPKPGTVDWNNASGDHMTLYGATMDRLKQRSDQRRVLAKPVFQDFDRHNNGHVTKSQFRQCLTMLELHCTEPEMIALEAKFCNDVGFNYLAFLSELQPIEQPKFMYEKRLEEIRQTNVRKTLPELNAQKDFESLLLKIKTKVSRERMRVLEFMRDYDKLRSGRMLKTSFRRALDLCRFELRESEVSILEDRYESYQDPEYVEYLKFCDEVESIFTTKELEKRPLEDVVQFKPPEEWELNKLPADQENRFTACMDRLSEKVRKHQMQLFPLFEDYDRVHNGTVSRSQFRRVLTELELGSLLSQQDFELLWQQFDVKIGGKDDVNYIAFCDMIYKLANFEPRKP
ncbi:hypothetical protein MAR_027975 [Mya arenaria]|uniref:EF-hand domain-containing protein n=1 Tax=Mya arenaria TaxID=6604 RepID=A0ABY7DJV7_MYAAR|nr:hypothetical protein MAR_027975 [Mya arenaria]